MKVVHTNARALARMLTLAGLVLMLGAWGPKMPEPSALLAVAPQPHADNSGQYLCPFTVDSTVAEWVSKGTAASTGAAAGSILGQEAGKHLASQIPVFGGFLAKRAGAAVGRDAAIRLVGGWDAMRASSDQSFDSVADMAVFMYANYSTRQDYPKIVELVGQIYPDFASGYDTALRQAAKKLPK